MLYNRTEHSRGFFVCFMIKKFFRLPPHSPSFSKPTSFSERTSVLSDKARYKPMTILVRMFQMIWLVEQDIEESCQTCQNKVSKFTYFAQFECNASGVSASSVFPFKNQNGKVKCSLKSGGLMAHENLDVINMAIRKYKLLAAGNKTTAALCFVNEQQPNSREQKRSARSNCWHR